MAALSAEIKGIIENWSEIKKDLPKDLIDVYNEGVADWKDLLADFPEEIDSMEDVKLFVENVKKERKAKNSDNRKPYSPATISVKDYSPKHRGADKRYKKKKEDEVKVIAIQPTQKTEDNLTETKKSGSADISIVPYGKGLLVYGDGTRAIKEDLKAIGGEWSTLRRKDKPANLKKGWVFKVNQKAQIEKVINGEIKADNVETIKIDDTKYKVEGPVKLDVILEDEITEYTKTGKGKIAEAPNWLKTMRTFINMAGKTKTVAAVRKAVLEIHDRFDAKRGRKNAHIELIREIYAKLRPYANKIKEKTVDLPEWADLVAKCKKEVSAVMVTSKVSRREIQEITLSGLGNRKTKTRRRK